MRAGSERHPPGAVRGVVQDPPPSRRRPPGDRPAVAMQFIKIVSRFKILAKMDIAEKRIPQDGAIAMRSGERRVDLRVNTVPTVFGEKMVMRLLDKAAIPLQLTEPWARRATIDRPDRVDPPAARPDAGHGSDRQRQEHHAVLLPEPAERPQDEHLHRGRPGGIQVQGDEPGSGQVAGRADVLDGACEPSCGRTPTSSWWARSATRRPPQICLRAALTGHFVLSTIHTNDSLSAVNRLRTWGSSRSCWPRPSASWKPSGSCGGCASSARSRTPATPRMPERHGLDPGTVLYRPKGCDGCRGTGYRGPGGHLRGHPDHAR